MQKGLLSQGFLCCGGHRAVALRFQFGSNSQGGRGQLKTMSLRFSRASPPMSWWSSTTPAILGSRRGSFVGALACRGWPT
jgi:hypothetical protein